MFTPRLSVYAISILLFLFTAAIFENKLSLVVAGTAAEISAVILIGVLVHHQASVTVQKLLAHRAAVFVGKMSYGMYLWHFPFALLLRDTLPFPAAFIIVATASVVFASISYFTVEAFFRRPRFAAAIG